AFSHLPLVRRLIEGRTEPVEGWLAPDYGVRHPAPTLVYSVAARLPFRILTLLVPVACVQADGPAVSMLPGLEHGPAGLRVWGRAECIRFEDEEGRPLAFRIDRETEADADRGGLACAASSAS